jgi:hypothetical protein
MGWVNWSRRLSLAVYYDVEQVRAGIERLRQELPTQLIDRIIGEAFLLEGLSRGYMRDIPRAHGCLVEAELRGTLTVEAVAQLLVCAESEAPEVAYWAAERVPAEIELGGRFEGRRLRVWRRCLVDILRAKGNPR